MAYSAQDSATLPAEIQTLSSFVHQKPHVLATGNNELQAAALTATKYVYDLAIKSETQARNQIAELLASISPALAPQTRSQAAAVSKSGRGSDAGATADVPTLQSTPLPELFIEDMNEEQIWAQLELRTRNVCNVLDFLLDEPDESEESEAEEMTSKKVNTPKNLRSGNVDRDMDFLGDMDFDSEDDTEESDDDEDDDDDEDGDGDDDEDEDEDDDVDLGEGIVGLRDPSDEEDEEDVDLDRPPLSSRQKSRRKTKVGGHSQLDDGFFDLAAFNAETEAAEARGVSKGRLSGNDSDDEDEEMVDLFAPVDDTATFHENGLESSTSEPLYKDFFDPPPRSALPSGDRESRARGGVALSKGKVRFHEEVRVRNIKAKGKNLPTSMMYEEEEDDEDDDDYEDEEETFVLDDTNDGSEGGEDSDLTEEGSYDGESAESADEEEEDGRDTMDRFKDDLFAEEAEESQQDMSNFEIRMMALRKEIAELEAESVAKKNWTLMGEATSRSRPQNSLLEEDLEFERAMKSVPVVTEETVHSLEERIKARIMENQYDDVVRKRPVEDKPFLPSRFFELQDTKSKQSLAEIYEDEYTTAQTGGIAGEDRDGKLKKEHEEIEKQWEQICGKLDALCNAHFTPKAPKAAISTVANVAAASLESALPTAMSTSSMLAPEEIFAPPSAGDLNSRSELTPTQKRALRTKQKKAKKKARDSLEKAVDKFAQSKRVAGIKKQKEVALKSVVKSGKGVTVIGKKSKDVTGKQKRTESHPRRTG
ncbi:uncharacterized protein FIBRA_04032 [Fibroporia radiculosa]|uniref:U3 small nucleolar ribonucleoprotein protein MPP10 n=1 Tax=Fibroporia radiculosa TaxID=599839 RepID=J4H2R0_9APHY|nr:uncharacterized protein FIBRA_04032 [Fibroporia radiculosa]CCM01959.1 predicted protein [Fibroporia radiculosa]